jgi:TrmH family RNA methyltransferase
MAPLPLIDSVANSMVKHAYSLKVPKKAKGSEDFLCEGFHLAQEALVSGLRIRYLLGTKAAWAGEEGLALLEGARKGKVRCFEASPKVLAYVADTVTPQGIVGVVQKPALAIASTGASVVLVAHQVQDAGNLGTLFRSAEAFGVSGLLLTEGSCDPFNPKVVRSSMGSLFRVPFSAGGEWRGHLESLKKDGYHCFALDGKGDRSLPKTELPRPLAIWVGSEGSGLPPELLGECEGVLAIPMTGKVESLNVGVAASLALFWAFQRRPLP